MLATGFVCANVFAMRRPVLIVIDMLNDFLVKRAEASKTGLLSSTKDLVGMTRQRGHPIIWVRQKFLNGSFAQRCSRTRVSLSQSEMEDL
jgi:nicotinamidase-related amidase